jgi:5-formyltetrahydrofolate cyclo-ligase
MDKSEARNSYKKKRLELKQEEMDILNQKIHDILFSRLMMHRYSPIHIYLPLNKNNETNTWNIIKTLRLDFAPEIYVPKIA